MNKKTILVFTTVAVVMYFGVSYAFRYGASEVKSEQNISSVVASGIVHEVVLSDEGFIPERIEIAAGDTVMWKTTRDRYFWPASNLHPTHLIYAEFDPREPMSKEETWSFTFERAGIWKYHDHLSPYFTGVVVVSAK